MPRALHISSDDLNFRIAVEFLCWIAIFQSSGLLAVRVLAKNGSVIATQFFDNRALDLKFQLRVWLSRHAKRNAHVLYGVNAFLRPKAKAEFAVPGRLLHVDADGVSLPPAGPEPTRIIESSPGNYHFVYVVDRLLSRDEAERLNKGLQRLVGGDVGGHSVAKLLRLPGTLNAKHSNRPRVEVIHEVGPEYTAAEILKHVEALLPAREALPGNRSTRSNVASGKLDALARMRLSQRRIFEPFTITINGRTYRYPGDDRSQVIFQIGMSMRRAGWADDQIEDALTDTLFWRAREADGKIENFDRLLGKIDEYLDEQND